MRTRGLATDVCCATVSVLRGLLPYSCTDISVLHGAKAVANDLQALAFDDYLACENYYQGFLHTQRFNCLNEMALLLHPELSLKVALSEAELLSVFYWFASVKAYFSRLFPNFFAAVPVADRNLLGNVPKDIGEELRQAMNAQIRALTRRQHHQGGSHSANGLLACTH